MDFVPFQLNTVHTGCIVKGAFLAVFRGFDFLMSACSQGIPQRDPLNLVKSPIFSLIRLVNPLVFTMPLVCTLLNKTNSP